MSALLRKEFLNLLPLVLVFSALLGMNLLEAPINSRMLELSWFKSHPALDNGEDLLYWFAIYIMGLCFAYSLFPREYDERTIDFLHTLPITRTQIFLGKFGAALLSILLVVLAQELFAYFLQSWNQDSLTANQFSLRNSAVLCLKSGVLGTVGLSHGLLASVGRHFGIYAIVFGAWALDLWSEHQPSLEVLKPTSIGVNYYDGKWLLIPWTDISLHISLSCLCLILAHRVWSRRGHQATHLLMVDLKKWPKLVGCSTVVFILGFLMLWAFTTPEASFEEEAADPQGFRSFETATTLTKFYEITFPTSLRRPAMALAQRADDVYKTLSLHLGAVGEEDRIVADLTDASHEHLGIASQGTLKIDLTDSQDPAILAHILCHETAHVLAYRLSGERGFDYSRLLSAFHEGTASYYAYELTESSRDLRDSRRHALATYQWHDLELQDLFDSSTLRRRLDDRAQYTLGEVWVAALVQAHGEEAPKKIWLAINREAPKDLDADDFWRDTYQAAGLSLEKTRETWESMLKELETREAEFLSHLPTLSVSATNVDGEYIINGEASQQFPKKWPGLVLRVREKGTSKFWPLRGQVSQDRTRITATVPNYVGDNFDYQVGIRIAEDGYSVVNEWRSVIKVQPR